MHLGLKRSAHNRCSARAMLQHTIEATVVVAVKALGAVLCFFGVPLPHAASGGKTLARKTKLWPQAAVGEVMPPRQFDRKKPAPVAVYASLD